MKWCCAALQVPLCVNAAHTDVVVGSSKVQWAQSCRRPHGEGERSPAHQPSCIAAARMRSAIADRTTAAQPTAPLVQRAECLYAACYCEENVFKLCERLSSAVPLDQLWAVFVSNPTKSVSACSTRAGAAAHGRRAHRDTRIRGIACLQVPLACQRASKDGLVVWWVVWRMPGSRSSALRQGAARRPLPGRGPSIAFPCAHVPREGTTTCCWCSALHPSRQVGVRPAQTAMAPPRRASTAALTCGLVPLCARRRRGGPAAAADARVGLGHDAAFPLRSFCVLRRGLGRCAQPSHPGGGGRGRRGGGRGGGGAGGGRGRRGGGGER